MHQEGVHTGRAATRAIDNKVAGGQWADVVRTRPRLGGVQCKPLVSDHFAPRPGLCQGRQRALRGGCAVGAPCFGRTTTAPATHVVKPEWADPLDPVGSVPAGARIARIGPAGEAEGMGPPHPPHSGTGSVDLGLGRCSAVGDGGPSRRGCRRGDPCDSRYSKGDEGSRRSGGWPRSECTSKGRCHRRRRAQTRGMVAAARNQLTSAGWRPGLRRQGGGGCLLTLAPSLRRTRRSCGRRATPAVAAGCGQQAQSSEEGLGSRIQRQG